jgi:sensor histidine kinase YesM
MKNKIEKSPNRRKKFYIDKKFQNRFILSYFEIIFFSIILSISITISYTFLTTEFGENKYSVLFQKIVNGKPELISPLSIVLPIIMASSLITLIVSFVNALFYSHKMAGPIYRLKKSCQELIEGKKNVSFKVRKDDEFHELSELLQKVAEKYYELEKEVEELKKSYHK